MAAIKKFKIYAFLFIGIIFLTSAIAMSSGKIRVFDFKYEKFEFLNGNLILELPGKPNRNMYLMYYRVLMDECIDLTLGHFEISVVDVNKYKGPKEEEFKNKLEIRREKDIDKDGVAIFRTAFWYGENPIVFGVMTSTMTTTFPTEIEREECIRKDDEIFEHIVESFRYRKEDGTYAKPEIIRQKEKVKEIEFHGAEYHGNSN